MKRLSILAVPFFAALAFLVSCDKDDSTHCEFLSPSMMLIGYTEDDMDTIVLRRFEKDNSFANLLDTTILSKGELSYQEVGEDTIKVSSTKADFTRFHSELFANDWEIYIPATGTTEQISEVKGIFESSRDMGEQCKSFVESMKYQGSTRTYTTWFGDSYRFFITKE